MYLRTISRRAVKELSWVKERPSISDKASRLLKQRKSDPSASTFLPLLAELPDVVHGIGYGSGVFPQKGHTKKVMVDLILVVEDSKAWHEENLARNSEHYSGLARMMGGSGIAAVQGEGGWFNPYVEINNTSVKYGVVSKSALLDDLRGWTQLYFAGRLHKPTLTLKRNEEVNEAQKGNLECAAAAAVLGLGRNFTKVELFTEISALSYRGDPRMSTGAEDPNKVRKLVESDGQLERFEKLYKGAIEGMVEEGIIREMGGGGGYEWDEGDKMKERLFRKLPQKVTEVGGVDGVGKALEGIVYKASIKQTMKGVVTAGVGKSFSYALEKVKKGRGV